MNPSRSWALRILGLLLVGLYEMVIPPFALLVLLTRAVDAASAPTFTDANWTSIGGLPGPNGPVYAATVDGSGNLYIGGQFTSVGGVFATNIAKWNGSDWSAVDSGLNGSVHALAISGDDAYAGGRFKMAGGIVVNGIAKWSGGSWSALGTGVNGEVHALAISGSNLYAGGVFNMGGSIAVIAKWTGSGRSALSPGIGGGRPFPSVVALAMSGSNLYVGGDFMFAGTNTANHIARWDGSRWSTLGMGIDDPGTERPEPVVRALAASGSNSLCRRAFHIC